MSTNVSSVVSHFPDAENSFTTTTAGSVSSGAVTVTLNSVAGYTNGEPVVLVIDPTDAAKKQTFTGIVDTSGVQITSVVWTAGTNQTHALGATVVDYATATHIAMMSKGIKVEHSQDGTHKAALITSRTEDTDPDPDADFLLSYDTSATALKKVKMSNLAGLGNGWTPNVLPAPNTVTALGNRSYSCVFNSVDLTGYLSAGMRLRTTRTVAAPTQCTSLNGTTQYYSKASPNKLTFTDDFVVSAWVKLSSYAAGAIASRYNGTSGWSLEMSATGQVYLIGYNAGAANNSYVYTYQSLPLNKWVHVTAQLDMSTFTATTTTSYFMFDGLDVPAAVLRGGTNPTALVQAGDLNIGAKNAGTFFPGKIAQVAIYNAKVTQANILATISQGLSGSETSLASAYSFNGVKTDLNTSTPNDLTANGSAVETNADSPFGGQADGTISSTLDYAIITKTAFSTNTTLTIQVPEGNALPTTGGVSAMAYSVMKAPYGMPIDEGRWTVLSRYISMTMSSTSAAWNSGTTNGSTLLNIPIGAWKVIYDIPYYTDRASGIQIDHYVTLSTANNSESDVSWTTRAMGGTGTGLTFLGASHYRSGGISLASATPYYLVVKGTNSDAAALGNAQIGSISSAYITATPAYL